MNSKVFSQRFNRELATLGLPEDLTEKIKAVSKVFDVSRHLANSFIFGHILPAPEQLDKIAAILEVCPQWLGGTTDKRKAYFSREPMNSESHSFISEETEFLRGSEKTKFVVNTEITV